MSYKVWAQIEYVPSPGASLTEDCRDASEPVGLRTYDTLHEAASWLRALMVAVESHDDMPLCLFQEEPVPPATTEDLRGVVTELLAQVDGGAFIDLADVYSTPISHRLRVALASGEPG